MQILLVPNKRVFVPNTAELRYMAVRSGALGITSLLPVVAY